VLGSINSQNLDGIAQTELDFFGGEGPHGGRSLMTDFIGAF
jgi:hypothetical protein